MSTNKCLQITVRDQRYLWLMTMWSCLEGGDCRTKSITAAAASCASLQCGLRQSNLQNIPTDVVMHLFTFLDIVDYVCNVSLVCKSWTININDILLKESNTTKTTNTAKFKLLKHIIYNSFKSTLNCQELINKINDVDWGLDADDLLFEMETSLSFALLHTASYQRGPQLLPFDSYPAEPLYFCANEAVRRFSYFYLLHYIYLYRFGGRDDVETMVKMYTLLSRIVFTGSVLCIGFMLELFYRKYGTETHCKQAKEDKFNKVFWQLFRVLFHQFYLLHMQHVQNKQIYVLQEISYGCIQFINQYARKWNKNPCWKWWSPQSPNNVINDMIKKANQKLFDD